MDVEKAEEEPGLRAAEGSRACTDGAPPTGRDPLAAAPMDASKTALGHANVETSTTATANTQHQVPAPLREQGRGWQRSLDSAQAGGPSGRRGGSARCPWISPDLHIYLCPTLTPTARAAGRGVPQLSRLRPTTVKARPARVARTCPASPRRRARASPRSAQRRCRPAAAPPPPAHPACRPASSSPLRGGGQNRDDKSSLPPLEPPTRGRRHDAVRRLAAAHARGAL